MKADLHIHTSFSDGFSSPKEVIETAIEKGIDCIAITDHNEIRGAIEAMRFGFDKNILIIPGIEISTKSGHILGINVKKAIPKGLSAERTIEEIRKQKGLAIIAHPFDWPIENFIGGKEKILALRPDGIEIFNAAVFVKSSNKTALNFARKNNFVFAAGSDAHRKEFIGRGYLEISGKINSEDDLVEAIKQGRVKPGGVPLSLWELLVMFRSNYLKVRDILRSYKIKDIVRSIRY